MEHIPFDIETAPLPDVEQRIHDLYPFNPDKVSLGNAKKPETVERIIEEARKAHVPDLLEKAALDPLLSHICAIGWWSPKEDEPVLMQASAGGEPQMLRAFWGRIEKSWTGEYTRWVGFNIAEFDIPFLFKRSWLIGVQPFYNVYKGRWLDDRIADIRQIWGFYDRYAKGKLSDVAKVLGCVYPDRPDDVDGKDFYKVLKSDPDKAFAYLKSDLYETREIAKRILNPLR